jgi:hypothetical protein
MAQSASLNQMHGRTDATVQEAGGWRENSLTPNEDYNANRGRGNGHYLNRTSDNTLGVSGMSARREKYGNKGTGPPHKEHHGTRKTRRSCCLLGYNYPRLFSSFLINGFRKPVNKTEI